MSPLHIPRPTLLLVDLFSGDHMPGRRRRLTFPPATRSSCSGVLLWFHAPFHDKAASGEWQYQLSVLILTIWRASRSSVSSSKLEYKQFTRLLVRLRPLYRTPLVIPRRVGCINTKCSHSARHVSSRTVFEVRMGTSTQAPAPYHCIITSL